MLTAGAAVPRLCSSAVGDRRRRPLPETRQRSDLVDGRGAKLLQRAEVPHQHLATHLAEARDIVEHALDHALGTTVAVMGDGEPVRLVADPLQEVEPLAGAGQDDRVLLTRAPRPPRAAWPDPRRGCRRCRARRGRAGRPRPAAGHRRPRPGRARRRTCVAGRCRGRPGPGRAPRRCPRTAEVDFGGLGALVEQSLEPAGDRLVHGGDVVLPVDALDHEPAVVALARQAVLEHHHRRDDLGALQVGHVVALDPQRRLLETAARAWISSSALVRVVKSLARLVLWVASDCPALRATVSIRIRLSPRCGIRSETLLPRLSLTARPPARRGRRAAAGPGPHAVCRRRPRGRRPG